MVFATYGCISRTQFAEMGVNYNAALLVLWLDRPNLIINLKATANYNQYYKFDECLLVFYAAIKQPKIMEFCIDITRRTKKNIG